MTRSSLKAKTLPGGVAAVILLIAGLAGEVRAARPVDAGGARYQREEVFAFTENPTCRKTGKDAYEITFASKGACDVTVGIVNPKGRIVRHLVAGVLGPNAPGPLQKNSLRQKLIWDGKNDLGRYVEAAATCRVRVGLGLKPVFDKVLLSHPNRMPWAIYGIAADRDGVYVFNTEGNPTMTTSHQPADLTNLLVYDHDGNYQRTILPIPREKVTPGRYEASSMHGQPEGRRGRRAGATGPFAFTLPTGKTVISPDPNGRYFKALEGNAFIVDDGMITAVVYPGPHNQHLQLFRLRTDGSRPRQGFYSRKLGDRGGRGPCWIAASPDRRWLYMSGLGVRARNWHNMNWGWNVRRRREQARHAVYRIDYDLDTPLARPFLGVENQPGDDSAHFRYPEGVATDTGGRLYVCDTGNDRVQVFTPDGTFLKSIPVPSPYQSAVHPKTGAIYILSYPVKLRKFSIVKLRSLAETKVVAEATFKAHRFGTRLIQTFCLDPHTPEPTLWIIAGNFHVQLWTDKGDRFELKRDLHADLEREWKGKIVEDTSGTGFSSHFFVGNMTADPHRPYLYLTDSRVGGPIFRRGLSPRIHVETGEVEITRAATVIGWDGLAYVRDGQVIYRYDPVTGQPVAFDYGSGKDGKLQYRFSSADGIGFGVSPRGEVIFHDRWPPVPGLVMTHEQYHVQGLNQMRIPAYMRQKMWTGGKSTSLRGYRMRQFFPGQAYRGSSAILRYRKTGEMKSNDVIGGIPRVSAGVRLDAKGNVYVGVPMAKLVDGKPIAGHSLVKFPPTGGRFLLDGPGVPIPLTAPPKRPADFRPLMSYHPTSGDAGPHGEKGYGKRAWAENMLWSFGGYFPFNNTKCVCLNGRFDLDFFARAFVPESFRNSISVLDTNGNFILRLGGYGNQDDRGPDIRIAHCRYVAVNDRRLYINDVANKRVLSVDLKYEREVETNIR